MVYLDTKNPPQTLVANNLGVNVFKLEDTLDLETAYSWMVIAKDPNGNTTESEVSSFTRRDRTAEAIFGKWFFESIGEPVLKACHKRSFCQFTEDSSLIVKRFRDDSSGDCNENRNES